jgi:predicted nucleotidyltransferase
MDTPKVLTREEAIDLVRRYKQVIAPRFDTELQVYLYGSYSKGNANPWSDIDVAVVLPSVNDDEWLEQSADLWHDVDKVSLLIEPVLMSRNESSPLYRDVMRTGIAV